MDNPEAALAKNNIRDVFTGNRQVDLSDARRVEALGTVFLAQPEFITNRIGSVNDLLAFRRAVDTALSYKNRRDPSYRRQPILSGFPTGSREIVEWGLYVNLFDLIDTKVMLDGGNVRLDVAMLSPDLVEYARKHMRGKYDNLWQKLHAQREELIARVIDNITGGDKFDPSLWM